MRLIEQATSSNPSAGLEIPALSPSPRNQLSNDTSFLQNKPNVKKRRPHLTICSQRTYIKINICSNEKNKPDQTQLQTHCFSRTIKSYPSDHSPCRACDGDWMALQTAQLRIFKYTATYVCELSVHLHVLLCSCPAKNKVAFFFEKQRFSLTNPARTGNFLVRF